MKWDKKKNYLDLTDDAASLIFYNLDMIVQILVESGQLVFRLLLLAPEPFHRDIVVVVHHLRHDRFLWDKYQIM